MEDLIILIIIIIVIFRILFKGNKKGSPNIGGFIFSVLGAILELFKQVLLTIIKMIQWIILKILDVIWGILKFLFRIIIYDERK